MKFYHSNSKKINKSFSKKNQKESDINSKLKISIIILAIIALVLLIIIFRYKYCCNMKKNSYRIENIEISTSDDSISKHSFSLLD